MNQLLLFKKMMETGLFLYLVILVVVNVSLLNTTYVDNAIQNLLILTVWGLTMWYTVNPRQIPFAIFMYSCCILALLMYHTLSTLAYFHSFTLDLNIDMDLNEYLPFPWVKWFFVWFDTVAFLYLIYMTEPPLHV